MNIRIIEVLLAAMICITMLAPAMAQPLPFVITGHVSDSDGNPCNGTWVQITNTNTSASWDAENDSASNYYKLVLDSDTMSAGNVLLFETSSCSETKMVEHTVTQSELEDGGINGFDIVLDAQQEIIWQGDVTLINGTTFDVTANSSVSYVINRTTALGALDAAAEDGIFNYTVNDDWYASWDSLFVDSIADIASEGYNGWMYWVNYPEDPMPGIGADQFVLEDGDVVTWYWSSSMDMTPANSSMLVDINVTVTSPDLIAVTIHSPQAITKDSTPLLHATFDQIAALTWYVIDDGAAVTGGSNTDNLTVTLPELPDGQHTVTVYANNSDGNVGSATQDFLVDTIAPVINSVTLDPADPNTGDNITVTVNATDNVGVTAVTADGVSLSNADGDDTW
ncbi:MAG: DUF4430 domain-containing protein, partial [ANME-2 cluster archaeon]|nr:DUF4430 domain-containing protein [ANME-2 cluster archaeon]